MLFIFIGAVLLIAVSGSYVFYAACVRRREISWLIQDEVMKTPYKKYYDHIVKAKQWIDAHHAKDVTVKSHDGLLLHGLWVPAENPRGTVLLCHGYRSSPLVDFGYALEIFHGLGMNLLIPDQRSHGKSQGRFITFGVKESRDMQQWIGLHNRELGSCPMFLYGLSMGASTVLYLADAALPDNVKGIIADCGFSSPKAIVSSVFKRVTHLPAVPSIWVTDLLARLFAGFSLTEKDTLRSLPNSRVGVLLIHGTQDRFVPCRMTRDAYSCCAEPKALLLVEGASHGVSFLVQPRAYTEKVVSFMEDRL